MGFRTVSVIRRVRAFPAPARMRTYTLAVVKDLDRVAYDADIDLHTLESLGHTVVVTEYVDMVVDIDSSAFPLREVVACCRHRQQRRTVERIKERAPAAVELLKAPFVQRIEQAADLFVEFREREEGVLA